MKVLFLTKIYIYIYTIYENQRIKCPLRTFPSPQSNYCFFPTINTKEASRHHHPNRNTPPPSRRPPTGKQIENLSRHNLRHPKTTKDGTPQSKSYLTMKKKMVHRLLTSLIHATSLHYNNMLLSKIIQGQDFNQSCRPRQKKPPLEEPVSATHSSMGKCLPSLQAKE
jgi:hypothetical protein